LIKRWIIAAAALAAFASPAAAQDAASTGTAPLPDPNDQSDSFMIGLGAGRVADYEGSDDYRIIPAGAIRARVNGINIQTRATYLYVDVVRSSAGKVNFDFGPIVGLRLNRSSKIKDDVVDLLPRRKKAIEVGGFAGVSVRGLTNPYDALSFRLDVVKDIGKAHQSTVVTPSVDFGTPLSRKFYVSVGASADFVADDYADYYFSITPADALASGLPVYDADGGFKNWKLSLLANTAITGDLTHGLSAFAIASYGRLKNDFADSPIVSLRGSPKQSLLALGLAYTF
jgi:outer membrane scaffolding protein for murein synthesis (MipA/OmpV family)